MNYKITPILCTLLLLTGCLQTSSKKTQAVTPQHFSLPQIPVYLTTPELKAEYITTHYWDNFNFADTTLIGNADYTEQAYADFVNLLLNVPSQLAARGLDTLMNRAERDNRMYIHFMEISEKYLYDPNSPFRNEELYIVVLNDIVRNQKLPDIEKVRSQYQLDLAQKNRVGDTALDFEFTLENGKKTTLYKSKGELLLLFFFRPDCPTCKKVKEYVATNKIDKRATIIWVNPDLDVHLDSIYDLRASPTLYLLDKKKTVLLKDAPIEQIEDYLKTANQ